MQFKNIAILSVDYVDAPHRVTSSSITDRLSETFQRFEMRPNLLESITGIKARRYWDEDTRPSQAAAWAAEKAIETWGSTARKSVC
mgnify:CR=1 FL=1